MKTVSPDRTYIDYWQNVGTRERVLKSHFGIRVWEDHCLAITNVAGNEPNEFGNPHPLPIDQTLLEVPERVDSIHPITRVIVDHMLRYPNSDLIEVLTGRKTFREAVS